MVAWDMTRESGCSAVRPPTSRNSLKAQELLTDFRFSFQESRKFWGLLIYIKNPSGLWGEGYSRGCAGWAGGSCRNPCERHRWLGETAELRILVYLCWRSRCMVPCYFNLHIFIINIVSCMSQQLTLSGR